MEPVRWGVISTARIGVAKVLPGMLKSREIKILAIASREEKRAKSWARKLGIPRAYGSYEAMLADPDIEAVYNPLPNHLHVPLTLAAARAGKHVLCEKPIALTAIEAEMLRDLPRDRIVAEAFMVRNHPQWQEARKRAQSGVLGDVHAIQVFFSYYNVDPKNVRNQADIGGGALLDIGCYPIVVARYIFGVEPVRAIAQIDRCPTFGVDRLTTGIVDFGGGRRLDFTVSTQSVAHQRVEVIGTKGRLEHKMEEAVMLGPDVKTPSGSTLKGDGTYIRVYPLRKPAYQVPVRASEGGHGGGDEVMLADLFAPDRPADPCLRAADERSGAYSILTGIAANHCFVTGQTTKIADLCPTSVVPTIQRCRAISRRSACHPRCECHVACDPFEAPFARRRARARRRGRDVVTRGRAGAAAQGDGHPARAEVPAAVRHAAGDQDRGQRHARGR